MVPVDDCWTHRPIDVETGTVIFAPGAPTVEGNCVERVGAAHGGSLWRAIRPGYGKIENDANLAAFIRVSRQGFVGRSVFRHLPDEEGEEPHGH